jgi:hypothetical protein
VVDDVVDGQADQASVLGYRDDHHIGLARPPKGGKPRDVPLPHQAAEALAAHLERFPATEITLPWQSPEGRPRTFALVFTGDKGGPAWRGRPLRARSSRSDESRTLPVITWAGT